jgi:hypothetical protein
MRRVIHLVAISSVVVGGFGLPGCGLETEYPVGEAVRSADHLVINEVFALPRTNQNTYCWIELYNPTAVSVDMGKWTLAFHTRRQVVWQDTSGTVWGYDDSENTFDVPLIPPNTVVAPDAFVTLVNNESRLLTYTDYGPGTGPKINRGMSFALPLDTVSVDSIRMMVFDFFLQPTDQIELKDSLGRVVDVVRFGNYAWSGPGADPYPSNHSAGPIADYQSLARYAGAYSTGNTAEDFYVTGVQIPQTRPIPHYFSQARHP